VSYYSHIDEINKQIEYLLSGQFTEINVRCAPEFEDERLGKRREYIRYYYESDDLISRNTDGETRDFMFSISFYFQDFNKKDGFNSHVFYQLDRLNWILCNEPTQNDTDDAYVWHDGRITGRERIQEVENLLEIRMTFVATKTCMWGTAANYAYGIYDFSDYGYSKYA